MAKILHIMLTGPVTDGWSYQDNLLTKYQRRLGHEVTMITSQWIWGEDGKLAKCRKTDYRNENDVKVIRLPIHGKDRWGRKFKTFEGLYEKMLAEEPDILFVHNVSFLDMDVVVNYIRYRRKLEKNIMPSEKSSKETARDTSKKRSQTTLQVYVDNHSDFSNSGGNWISRNVLHKILWKSKAKKIEPYTTKFYGVMPARVEWLSRMYGIPEHKCELLVMGADDDGITKAIEYNAAKRIREQYHIAEDDFLIVTGGKIDRAKRQTLLLMEAVRNIAEKQGDMQKEAALNKASEISEIRESDSAGNIAASDSAGNTASGNAAKGITKNVRLLVFGSVAGELKDELEKLADGNIVQYTGWIAAEESYDYFSAADLVVFPGRHSVYWEQVVGMGIPMLCKYWEGTTHVDIGGNVRFLTEDNVSCIENSLLELLKEDGKEYLEMKAAANSERKKEFSYLQIAQKCIEQTFY